MAIRLVDTAWNQEFQSALTHDASTLSIISPFIKSGAVERLLAHKPAQIRVITRFNLDDFAQCVSDLGALWRLLDAGARVRGVRNLHAKLYLFGDKKVALTSANLTIAALDRNHEFGMVTEDREIIADCEAYIEALWRDCGPDLTRKQIDAWTETVTRRQAQGSAARFSARLPDFGANLGSTAPPALSPCPAADTRQAFIKFLGEAKRRVPSSFPIIEEVKRAGCHWAVAYPANRRPKNVADDAVIFIGRLTENPNDIRIFGRAIGMKHQPGRDDATAEDIELRAWKKTWPRYIRLHNAEFVASTMQNGVSQTELMDALGSDSFASTQRNAAKGDGNVNPRRAYSQQPAVELSQIGLSWLSERLQVAFDRHGVIPPATLRELDWPRLGV